MRRAWRAMSRLGSRLIRGSFGGGIRVRICLFREAEGEFLGLGWVGVGCGGFGATRVGGREFCSSFVVGIWLSGILRLL